MAVNTGVLQASYVYTLDAKTYTNQVHFPQDPGDANPTSLAAHAAEHGAAIRDLWADEMAPLLAANVSLIEIALTYFDRTQLYPDIPPAPVGTPRRMLFRPFEEFAFTTGLPVAGGVAGQYLPGFNAFRARKITTTPGRRYRGHNSISGIPEAGSAGNILETGDWTTWQTNAPAFLGAAYTITPGGFPYVMNPVVLSQTDAEAVGIQFLPASTYARKITSIIPNRLIGTMRRRKKKTV